MIKNIMILIVLSNVSTTLLGMQSTRQLATKLNPQLKRAYFLGQPLVRQAYATRNFGGLPRERSPLAGAPRFNLANKVQFSPYSTVKQPSILGKTVSQLTKEDPQLRQVLNETWYDTNVLPFSFVFKSLSPEKAHRMRSNIEVLEDRIKVMNQDIDQAKLKIKNEEELLRLDDSRFSPIYALIGAPWGGLSAINIISLENKINMTMEVQNALRERINTLRNVLGE